MVCSHHKKLQIKTNVELAIHYIQCCMPLILSKMKKAIIVEYSFMTRIVIDEENENLETIVAETKKKILDKVNNELSENLCEWYDDEEMPYDAENELSH